MRATTDYVLNRKAIQHYLIEAVHCPKCGAIIERRAWGSPRRLVW